MKRIFTLLFSLTLFIFSNNAISQISNHVVVSQLYGAGGNSSAAFNYDYVELFNPTAVDVVATTWSVQYASASGTTWAVNSFSGTIKARQYFLIRLASNDITVGAALPAVDATPATPSNMSGTSGKLALVNSTTALTGSCPTGDASVIDFVGYGAGGSAPNCFEGSAPTPAFGSNAFAIFRLFNGCIDANNNASDFASLTANPRNSSSPVNNCSLLPLSFTSFNASFNGRASQLKWSTANESNLKGFSVERSIDGTTYSEFAFIPANNVANQNNYSFEDMNVVGGVNYYRIKIVSNDGSYKYSQVFVINNKLSLQVEVFPNPAANTLTITHSKAGAGATLRLLSIEGKQIKTQVTSMGSVQTALSVSELIRGNYLLIFEDKGQKTTAKFTKL